MEVLKQKTYKEYSYTSRYAPFPYYYNIQDEKYYYGISANLDDTTLYTLHTIKQGDTIDNLALYYYNNPTLFWIICDFNRIKNPYIKLYPGKQIKIPSISNIRFDTGEER